MTHYWQTVDGWFNKSVQAGFDRMIAALPADRPSTLVQVGTWMGRATAYVGVEIVNSGKPATLVAVDHFKGSAEMQFHARGARVAESHAQFVEHAQPLVDALGDRFRLIVSDSAQAADHFDDGSVDAVWIDAAHDYEFVVADIDAWTPKVRRRGLIGGDDFDRRCPGVTQAVLERFGQAAVVPGAVWWMVRL